MSLVSQPSGEVADRQVLRISPSWRLSDLGLPFGGLLLCLGVFSSPLAITELLIILDFEEEGRALKRGGCLFRILPV